MDAHHGCVSTSPVASASNHQQVYCAAPRHAHASKCNPLLRTYTNCLHLKVAALTFLWEMKISGGAEQPILDSVVN